VLGICCEAVNGGGGLGRAGHPWPAAVLGRSWFFVRCYWFVLEVWSENSGTSAPGELRCRFGSAEQSGPAWFYHAF